jgi:hypothetical protein
MLVRRDVPKAGVTRDFLTMTVTNPAGGSASVTAPVTISFGKLCPWTNFDPISGLLFEKSNSRPWTVGIPDQQARVAAKWVLER